MDKKKFVQDLVSKMTLEQKVGQCFVIGYVGSLITPEIINRVKKYYPAGIRAGLMWRIRTVKHDPNGTNTDYAHRLLRPFSGTMKDFLPDIPVPHFTNEEFCEYVNTIKQAALDSDLGIPLHFTFDFEGDVSADYYRGGIKYFPSCMGLAHSNDPEMAHDVAWSVGRQLAPLGFDWIHSPVLDVNTNPRNPEIGTRSYGEDPEEVITYAKEALRGFKDAGIIATGKHFPGRGPSAADAHHGLPVIDESREELMRHLEPYRALIKEGLPAIMTAHTAYPALDPSGLPATLSKPILTDLLKGELGFEGVVTTDEITMGGIIQKFDVPEACVRAIDAGCDLVLLRDEGGLINDVIPGVIQAVREGRLSEDRVNDAVTRTLSVKYDYGFFEQPQIKDPKKASEGINDAKVAEIAVKAAKNAINVIRDENNVLPVSKDKKVMFIYQVNPLHERTNTQTCHPAMPWMKLLEHSDNVYAVETTMKYSPEDRKRVYERIHEADVIIITNYFDRRSPESGNNFVQELHQKTDKPIIVMTNSPYPFTVQPEYKTVVCTYSSSVESAEAFADTIFGE
ncbi:glycoside hydrolase family 3 protein [Cuneatibacter caecimuris]|uniref:Beta-N-acetylhexosaminidase n=1 Tax=Cuneatibacter caecimuris TaxID=1796618 RepID=A0A4Q7PMD6_9FIRM|nr:glycoside hydrolase family 3 protein [Cuneatibacter caecimuris]RZT02101.1 beta-N-acetylhexosaminidase [Cuneatibacter caecimuris]